MNGGYSLNTYAKNEQKPAVHRANQLGAFKRRKHRKVIGGAREMELREKQVAERKWPKRTAQ